MTINRRGGFLLLLIFLFSGCQSGAESDASSDDEETTPVPVETARPTRGDVHAVYTGTAPVEAFAEAEVVAKVAGEVRTIRAEEGDIVKKGQILATLDGDRLRLELNESEARLRKLQRDYERNVDLSSKGLISAGDFEKIKFDMEALQAAHNLASLELDYTQIRAPIDGTVSERYIKIGNTLAMNDPVFRVTGLDPLVAYLHVPEREFSRIKVGQPAALQIDALAGPPIIAGVSRVSPVIDPVSGTFKVTIEISDVGRQIKPGMFARIGIVYDSHLDALQVPRSALLEQLGQSSVFVVEDGVAIRKNVETGYADRGRIEIVTGLDEQDDVIVIGQLGLKANSKVNVVNKPDRETQNASTD
ncbi:MAG: efflux RND transporter periplasmic adaptor subunit [Woeseiaceae bacterium]|nr:efflux RND transporter periplasmic adaptor subunit [Woeseiaceae bacterium]